MTTLHVQSCQLGPLEVPEESTIEFRSGILGFPGKRRFCVVEVKPGSRFQLLQSTDDGDLAFVVIDPLQLEPTFPLDAAREIAARQGLEADEPSAVAAIVTVPPPPARPTVNLLAPLVMGRRSRRGVQVVLHEFPYEVRREL